METEDRQSDPSAVTLHQQFSISWNVFLGLSLLL